MRLTVLSLFAGILITAYAYPAEISNGARMDEFSLSDASSRTGELKFPQDKMLLVFGGEALKPKALLIHFFQPDCLQCQVQMKAEELLFQDLGKQGLAMIGIAHRGTPDAVKELGMHLKLSFPLLIGTDSEIAKKAASGDALYLLDDKGIVRYSQAGYGSGDEKLWKENIALLIEGKAVVKKTTDRERLQAGDRLPAIVLNNLVTGKPMKLVGDADKLQFTDDSGKTVHPALAIGFFCRF